MTNTVNREPFEIINKIHLIIKGISFIFFEVINVEDDESTLYLERDQLDKLMNKYDELYGTWKGYKEMKEFKQDVKDLT